MQQSKILRGVFPQIGHKPSMPEKNRKDAKGKKTGNP